MHVEHVADGTSTVLATNVSIADTFRRQLQGVMFKSSLPDGYGLVFPFDESKARGVHMVFVRVPIDVVWTVDDRVRAVEQLQPWTGYGRAEADQIFELPAGTAAAVTEGDRVSLQE